jgi:hypothetical protein
MTTTQTTKTITFDGGTYRTSSLAAEVAKIEAEYTGIERREAVRSALMALAVRREHGRTAWVHGARSGLRSEDGSRREVEATVGIGARGRDGLQSVEQSHMVIDSAEVDAAIAALGSL